MELYFVSFIYATIGPMYDANQGNTQQNLPYLNSKLKLKQVTMQLIRWNLCDVSTLWKLIDLFIKATIV